MKYNEDKQLADLVCEGNEKALHQFYDIVKDDLYKASLPGRSGPNSTISSKLLLVNVRMDLTQSRIENISSVEMW